MATFNMRYSEMICVTTLAFFDNSFVQNKFE
jgi:hypothetical protein